MALQVRELMSWDDAAGLEPRWEALVERNATDTVFLSYAWLRTWWQHFGKGSRLLLLVVESGDELVGAAPLMIDRLPLLEGGAVRVRFTANWQAGAMDLLAAPEERQAVVAAVTDYLLRQAPRWDVLDLDLVPSESENLCALEMELRSRGLRAAHMQRWELPYLPLCGNWEEQKKHLRKKLRQSLARKLRLLERQPDVRFVSPATAAGGDLFGGFLAVSRKSWQGRWGRGLTSSPELERFHADLWEAARERGWESGAVLEIGGDPAAFQYALDYHGRTYLIVTGYDPRYAECAPGSVVIARVVQGACEAGQKEVEFGGDLFSWKQQWTGLSRQHVRLLAFRRGLRARASHAVLFVLRPRVKRLPGVQWLQRLVELATRRQRPSRGGDK